MNLQKKLSDQLDGARVHFTVNERSIVIHDVFECARTLSSHENGSSEKCWKSIT